MPDEIDLDSLEIPEMDQLDLENFKGIKKQCEVCGARLRIKNEREITRKRFCSHSCKGAGVANERPNPFAMSEEAICPSCNSVYTKTFAIQKFCSDKCVRSDARRKYKDKMSNLDLDAFLSRLLTYKPTERKELSAEFLIELYNSQDGLCALSGVKLTWDSSNSRAPTNASIDRKDSNLGYSIDNVQLVCYVVNIMKSTLQLNEFVSWCKAIVDTNTENQNANS